MLSFECSVTVVAVAFVPLSLGLFGVVCKYFGAPSAEFVVMPEVLTSA